MTWMMPWAYQSRPSKPSPLDNPAFRRWFGSSVIRNRDGTPRVVYHGTTRRGEYRPRTHNRPIHPYWMENPQEFMPVFTEFKPGSKDIGIHFGTKEQASSIIDDIRTGIIYPAYIRLENPLRMNDTGNWLPEEMAFRLAKHPEDIPRSLLTSRMMDLLTVSPPHDPPQVRLLNDNEVEKIIRFGGYETMGSARSNELMRQLIVEALQSRGYDGIVYLNRFEAAHRKVGKDPVTGEDLYMRVETDSYIVFDPRQIKAVYGNRGTFDPEDPDILHGWRR